MNVGLQVIKPHWELVYKIPKGTPLIKGRHGAYHEIISATDKISESFGCYGWGLPESIFYIGSFSKNYKHGSHKSNLSGRVHNYLQNHSVKDNGQKNTNLVVFESLNESLLKQELALYVYKFECLELGGERIEYETYTNSSYMVLALEQLLICLYKKVGQCNWNRA